MTIIQIFNYMTQEEINKITARVVQNYNGWYTIEIYYDGKVIKTIEQWHKKIKIMIIFVSIIVTMAIISLVYNLIVSVKREKELRMLLENFKKDNPRIQIVDMP